MFLILQKLLNSAFYVAITGLIAGFVFAMFPQKILLKLKNVFSLKSFEKDGKFYSKYLKINTWKDKLPQFSEITKFGFSKASLNTVSSEYLEVFYIETMRAELTHWFLILISPIYLLFAAKTLPAFTIVGNIIGNVPFILIQRYNRGRVLHLLNHIKKLSEK